ncbi:MAG: hypothetical protein CL874_02120 [Dehalococcoidales bacterium]|jgi:TRAP-type mannitol/chloroaromatic compound transport system permease small subunit|nr:hypothetical protein [Dehalococcoidales bacterium]MDP6577123.1 TRAP transporter small permease subunit [Dehalococcoidales bacterium]|tara:strand:- start:462 stop:977 length:516 start_codon:yes stop_codon:yes gene_type:complete
MKILKSAIRGIESVSEVSGKSVSLLILVLAAVVFFDVVMRYVFDRPTVWAYEVALMLSGTAMVVATAWTHKAKGHVEVDVLKLLFPAWVRLVVDLVLTLVLALPWVTLLIIGGWGDLLFVVELKERTMTPFEPYLWMFKWVLPTGFFLLWLQVLASFTRDLFTLIKGKVVV